MKFKPTLRGVAIAAVLQLGVRAVPAQTTEYLYSGSETHVALNLGTYEITAYGASGYTNVGIDSGIVGGTGAMLSVEFNFSSPTNLTLLVGLSGGSYFATNEGSDGGGGGGSFVVEGNTSLLIAGGGGGVGGNNGSGSPGGSGNYLGTGGGEGLTGGIGGGRKARLIQQRTHYEFF
jgi:hypothetical protein